MEFIYIFGLMFLVIFGAAALLLPLFSALFSAAYRNDKHRNDTQQRNRRS